jgi:hypothetical protein
MKADIIRLILTIALMYEVWTHSHWSVALSLTLLAIGNECQGFMLRRFL